MHHHNCQEKNKQNVTSSQKNGPMELFVGVKGESVIITRGDVELAATEKFHFLIGSERDCFVFCFLFFGLNTGHSCEGYLRIAHALFA